MVEIPRHPDFERIYQKFLDLYGEEKGEQVYYAWLNKYGLDDTKPYDSQEQGLIEAFSWVPIQFAQEAEDGKYWKVWAISKGLSMNDNPYEKNLDKAARSLENRTVNLNHIPEWTLPYGWPDSSQTVRTVACEFEDNYVEALVWVGNDVLYPGDLKVYKSKTINQMLEDRDIIHPSIEALPRVPKGVEYDGDPSFIGLALLTREYLPGDPLTKIEPMVEHMMLESIRSRSTSGEKKEMREENMETQWTTQYKNDLPDECFAYIEPGGEKDEDGKTVPRDLRHFPYKNHLGELSKEHINNGLGQLNKDLGDWATDAAKAEIKKALCAAVKRWNRDNPDDKIDSDVCDIHPEESGKPKLKTEEMDYVEEPSVEDRLDWLSQDISRIWDELWRLREDMEQRFDAVNKRIDDAITLITGVNLEALKEQDDSLTLADLKALIDDLERRVAALEQEAEAEQDDEEEEPEDGEEQDGPRSNEDRAKAHFGISDEEWDALTDEEKQAYIDKLPPRGKGGEADEDEEDEEAADEVCGTCTKYVDGKCTVSGQLKAKDDECDTGEYEDRPEEPVKDGEDDLEESKRSISEMKTRIKDLESKLSLAEARAQTWMNVADRRRKKLERRR